jgi:beta-lactamase class D
MLHRREFLTGLAAAGSLACGRAGAQAELPVVVRPEALRVFADAGTEGTFALLQSGANRLVMTDETRTRQGMLPASTFKVPHALIALETGVVADTDSEVIKWDGVNYDNEEWNRDHTLRSAMKYSVVPVFKQVARRIGAERMQRFVDQFDYGNKDIGGADIDAFWLSGNLRISPIEQTQFLQRFDRGQLPVTKRNLDLVKDIVPVEKTEDAAIHAKTGTIAVNDKPTVGWLVGWVEHGDAMATFAMNIDIHAAPHLAGRMAMAQTILQELGAI